jgi:outer membrane protein assembly factor BamB
MSPFRRPHPSPTHHGAAALALGLALTALSVPGGGCGKVGRMIDPSGPSADRAAQPAPVEDPEAAEAGRPRETRYVVDLDTARTLGYRIDWQLDTRPAGQSGLRRVVRQGDSIFALDGRNYLTRIRVEDGQPLWRQAAAEPVEEILGINYVPALERVYLTHGGSVLVLDAVTGIPADRQQLQTIANTQPVLLGQFLIFGGRNGQVVWHSHLVSFQNRSYQIARSVQIEPLLVGNALVAVGTGGRLVVLDGNSASQLWGKTLLDAITARPAVGGRVLYVAAHDQYLYAFDLLSGRTLWSTLTTAPLDDSPTVVGDRVYQQIPGEGLTCFDALPLDSPGGEVLWTAAEVTGNVLTQRRQALLAWDAGPRRLVLVDPGRGAVIDRIDLPDVGRIGASAARDGEILAAADDGRIIRLVPR